MRDSLWGLLPKECGCCGITGELHIHHIVPLALGGTNRITNLCVLCGTCHGKIHGLTGLSNHTANVMAGKEKIRNNGKWSSGIVPYGYTSDRKRGVIEIDEDEAEVVRLMYRLKYVSGLRVSEIKDILDHMLIGTRKSNKWECSTLTQILNKHDVYLGKEYKGVTFPAILDDEYEDIVGNYSDTKKRKKRTYAGFVIDEKIVCAG